MGKAIKRILLGIFILIFVVLAAAAVIPLFFKKQIVEKIKTEANKSLTAVVNFNNNVGISIFKHFPKLTLTVDSLSIANTGDFSGDTLLSVKQLAVTVNLMSVIKGDEIEINRVYLDQPRINVRVLKDGRANYDITKPDTTQAPEDTSTTNFKIGLKKFEIVKGDIIYDDASLGVYTHLVGLNHQSSGDLTADETTLKTLTDVDQLTVGYGGLNYLTRVATKLKADIHADLKNFKFTLEDNELQLNQLFMGFEGWVAMPSDDINMDLKFNARQTDFRNLLSLVPAVYTKDFDKVKTSGKIAFDGMAKGTYNDKLMPAFAFNLKVADASFRYPDLPTGMNNIQVDLKVNSPDANMDHMEINLARMHMEVDKDPFDARALVKTPMSDPAFDVMVKGRIDLAQVSKLVPIAGTTLSGVLNADAAAKGRMSMIDKQEYESLQASGTISAQNVLYNSKDLPQPFALKTGALNFSPREVSISNVDATFGPSDLRAEGAISNFFGYMLRDEVLKGSLTLNSNLFDANSILAEDPNAPKPAPQPEDTLPLTVIEVPANIDFTMKVNAGKVLYDNLALEAVTAQMQVVEQSVIIKDAGFKIFKGSIGMNGLYHTKNPKKPVTDLNFRVNGVDIPQAFAYMSTVQALVPIAKYATGNVTADFKFNSELNEHMMPVLNLINASGSVNIPNLGISGYKPMEMLAAQLHREDLKALSVKQLATSFEIKDGRLSLKKPLQVPLGGKAKMSIKEGGYTTLAQELNYTGLISVPRGDLGKVNDAFEKAFAQAAKTGIKLNMDEVIDLGLKIGGTTTSPKISIDFESAKSKILGGLKDQVMTQLNEKKEEVIQKVDEKAEKALADAKAKGDKLISEAEKQGEALRAEARKQADNIIAEADKQAEKLIKDAGSNPLKKVAAEKAAEKVKSEARKKADQVNAEADKKANDLVAKARAESDRLYKEAQDQKNSLK